MATQGSNAAADRCPAGRIRLSSDFRFNAADEHLEHNQKTVAPTTEPPPPLGVLSNFTGDFAGDGFNLIFRPNSGPPTTTTFPNPVTPAPPQAPSEQVLELNLTTETLSFSNPLGSVPNRGLQSQNDVFLNGVPYVQTINDVANVATGKADGAPIGIHFEPGLWMHLPATTNDPVVGESLVRMASIPHGTTINAQGLAPAAATTTGPPSIPSVDITPFVIGQPSNKITFAAQTASNTATPRLPQDLSKFIAAGTITQAILNDPNTVLRDANKGKQITQFTTINIDTQPTAPELGGGTANIAFLTGANNAPNANAAQMTATFWIETVLQSIKVSTWKPGQPALKLKPTPPFPGARVPTFSVTPPHEIKTPTTIGVTSTQIQYSQNVSLNFAGLTWPHVSVATLIPTAEQVVPASAFS